MRWGRVICVAMLCCPAGVMAADPVAEPGTAPLPQYPVPYQTPTVAEITQTLEQIRLRIESATPVDFGLDGSAAAAQKSVEKKFPLIAYPMGVIFNAMLGAADATGDKAFADYDAKVFSHIADEITKGDVGGPVKKLLNPHSLDDCGAMVTAMIKARRAKVGPDLKSTIDRCVDYVHRSQFRLEDGTLARNGPFKNSIWGDDMFMGAPMLAQAGALTGNADYFDDAARQVLQIGGHLFVPSTELFTHAWNGQNPDDHPRYYWGRANGWCMLAMVEVLEVLPADHPQREAILRQLRAQARGVANVQSGSGLWHQLLDRPDSYLETSCSAMFTFSLARGVNRGWLNANAYGPVAQAGWNGLSTKISEDGHISGICIGTSYADDTIYYYNRPAADDVHGYGPVLMAGSEMIQMLKNPRLKIQNPQKGGATMYQVVEH